jgi:hypothetical protein
MPPSSTIAPHRTWASKPRGAGQSQSFSHGGRHTPSAGDVGGDPMCHEPATRRRLPWIDGLSVSCTFTAASARSPPRARRAARARRDPPADAARDRSRDSSRGNSPRVDPPPDGSDAARSHRRSSGTRRVAPRPRSVHRTCTRSCRCARRSTRAAAVHCSAHTSGAARACSMLPTSEPRVDHVPATRSRSPGARGP